jgi:predicted ribosome quality control (RQC) complex YloA/Tae2 family protein
MFDVNSVWPNWNWKEVAAVIERIAPEIQDLFVDRIVVPARPEFPNGYLKSEWVIRLTGRKAERSLLVSTRARHPYIGLFVEKGPQAATTATKSAFDQALSKHLKGSKLVSCRTLPKERCVVFDFSGNPDGDLTLVISMIPATPEALLVKRPKPMDTTWSVIARSRLLRGKGEDTPKEALLFTPPDGARAPVDMPIREELRSLKSILQQLETNTDKEAFVLRLQESERKVRDLSKQTKDRVRQSEVAKAESQREADWQRYGDLLKANMGMLSKSGNSVLEREVLNFETDEKIKIPCDPKLDLRQQVEKFFSLAQRKSRRASEAQNRIQMFTEILERLKRDETILLSLRENFGATDKPDWKKLEEVEHHLRGGIAKPVAGTSSKDKRKGAWLGKSFVSKDGWAVWAGRSKDENLELTFKHARGNDMWLHVRGRPGSHAVIPVQPGKSIPLETLLDAANIVIHYSNGQNWGKTEVDYTFKKYVKRIKDSTEASYTNNKTLIVELDPQRMKRLLGGES